MAYNLQLANRIREGLLAVPQVEEKLRMGGITFMVNDKVCLRVVESELLCRVGPDSYEEALSHGGCQEWVFKGKSQKGWVLVNESCLRNQADFDYWINLSLAFNEKVKAG